MQNTLLHASVYVGSIVLAVIFVATYSLVNFVNVFAALFASGFLLGTTVILVLAFVPNVSTASCCVSLQPCTQASHTYWVQGHLLGVRFCAGK